MTCQQFRKLIDSYVSDELLVETNHDVLTHLENCADCRCELSAYREMRSRVAMAVKNSRDMVVDPVFARRVSDRLRQTALKPTVWETVKTFKSPLFASAAGFAVLIVILGSIFVFRQRSGPNGPLTAGIIDEIMTLAVGDHENCAVHFALKEKPISLSEAADTYGDFYRGLDITVADALDGDYQVVEKHSCVFEGQRFAHIVLKHGDRVVSVLVARIAGTDEVLPASRGPLDGYQTASSFGQHYELFVISDLSESENLAVAASITPAIARHMAA